MKFTRSIKKSANHYDEAKVTVAAMKEAIEEQGYDVGA